MSNKSFALDFDGYWREPNITGLPTHSGVYCIYTCTYDQAAKTVSLESLVYIGEADNVNERIANHEKWEEWRSYLMEEQQICISTAPVDSTDRNRVEAALIYHHKPSANTEYKNEFPFDQTTITTQGRNGKLTSVFTVTRTVGSLGVDVFR